MEGDKIIQNYHFNRKNIIGEGSYATVYKGKIIGTEQPVAIKMINKKLFLNSYNLKNIQSQIDIMKLVNHQNIVKLHNIYQTANNMYIVTQFCQDKDLYHLLQNKKNISEIQAKKYLKEIINGIKYLHSNGIIHRDLKPANILLKNNICKISDFGFAKSLEDDDAVMKSIVGTPLYMSPQLLKRKKYTNKSDLWSIGLIYYQMLHDHTPWPAKNQIQLINAIYSKPIVFKENISQKSKDFIRRCLQINEEDRMSWEQAFEHPLIKQPKKQSLKQILSPDKENLCFNSKKVRRDFTDILKKRQYDPKRDPIPKNNITPKSNITPIMREKLRQLISLTPLRDKNEQKKISKDL